MVEDFEKALEEDGLFAVYLKKTQYMNDLSIVVDQHADNPEPGEDPGALDDAKRTSCVDLLAYQDAPDLHLEFDVPGHIDEFLVVQLPLVHLTAVVVLAKSSEQASQVHPALAAFPGDAWYVVRIPAVAAVQLS